MPKLLSRIACSCSACIKKTDPARICTKVSEEVCPNKMIFKTCLNEWTSAFIILNWARRPPFFTCGPPYGILPNDDGETFVHQRQPGDGCRCTKIRKLKRLAPGYRRTFYILSYLVKKIGYKYPISLFRKGAPGQKPVPLQHGP
jgi:hypothetical protein